LLVVAYATCEEFEHTYTLIGCAIAALIVTSLYWELVRPHSLHLRGAHAPPALRGSLTLDAPAFVAIAVLVLTAVLAAVALILMAATHHLWPATAVDEKHEAVGYFALGLVALYIATVVIASSDHLERRLGRLLRRH
jgi:hypothetical protein